MTFYPLQIKLIEQETPNANRVGFEIPDDLNGEFKFLAGQYLTLKTEINGEEVRRDYSLCTNPASGLVEVVIKKVEDGLFSPHANSRWEVGDSIDVAAPQGRFTFEADPEKSRQVVAFAAGSGITPIMGIMKTLLENEPQSKFHLIYGNQNVEETIFYDTIQDMVAKYEDRLSVRWVFSKANIQDALFGRIDEGITKFSLNQMGDFDKVDSYYLCGPGGMIETVSSVLESRGVDKEKIKFELFTPIEVESNDNTSTVSEGNCKVEVIVDDEEAEFEMPKNKTILEMALKAGIDAPYSCQGGICSSCIARLTEGEVKMRQNNILTDGEVADGLILTCQSEPISSSVKIDYDDV